MAASPLLREFATIALCRTMAAATSPPLVVSK